MLSTKILQINLIKWTTNTFIRITASNYTALNLNKRDFSSNENKIGKINPVNELRENWKQVYRFPKIATVSAVNKLKNYQMTACIFGLPVTYFYFHEHFFTVGYLGCTLVFSLGLLSYMLRNSIGVIYVHKSNSDLVRIAYINFWGKRKDSEFKVTDIVPFSDLPKSSTDKVYTSLKFNNGHENLKLLSKEVEIVDYDNFVRIFGE